MEVYSRLRRIGGLLFTQGLVSLSAGNMSVRAGDFFYITSSGSLLGDLNRNEIVKVSLSGSVKSNSINQPEPSVEEAVHRSIYLNTSLNAVVHAHPPTALALAERQDVIKFSDAEGRLYLKEVPVIKTANTVASGEVARKLPPVIKMHPAAIIRSHGAFATSDTPEKAASLISTLEFSCRIDLCRKLLNRSEN